MASGFGIGGFASGLAEGMKTAQEVGLRGEFYREKKRNRKAIEAADTLGEEFGKVSPEDIVNMPLAGPTEDGQPLRSTEGNYGRLQSMRAQAMALPSSEERQRVLDQLDDLTIRTTSLAVSEAAQYSNGRNPELEAAALNKAAKLAGMNGNYVHVNENNEVVTFDGQKVDKKAYLYLYAYAQNPAAALERLRGMEGEDRAADLEETRVGAIVTQVENQHLQFMAAHDLDVEEYKQLVIENDRRFKLDERLADSTILLEKSHAEYYKQKASEAQALAELTGQTVWDDPTDHNAALNAVEEEFDTEKVSEITEAVSKATGVSRDETSIRMETLAKAAVSEHGVGGRAGAVEGAMHTELFMSDSSQYANTLVTLDQGQRGEMYLIIGGAEAVDGETNETYIEGGKRLPISRDAAKQLQRRMSLDAAAKSSRKTQSEIDSEHAGMRGPDEQREAEDLELWLLMGGKKPVGKRGRLAAGGQLAIPTFTFEDVWNKFGEWGEAAADAVGRGYQLPSNSRQ